MQRLAHAIEQIPQVLALAAAVEASSEHPVAAAVLDAAAARLAPDAVTATPRSARKGAGGGKRAVDWVWPAVDIENDHGRPLHPFCHLYHAAPCDFKRQAFVLGASWQQFQAPIEWTV